MPEPVNGALLDRKCTLRNIRPGGGTATPRPAQPGGGHAFFRATRGISHRFHPDVPARTLGKRRIPSDEAAITTETYVASARDRGGRLDVARTLLENLGQRRHGMKLKPLRPLPSVKLVGRVTGGLHADLAAYAAYYREVIGEPIDLWPLAVHILGTFLDSDRAFQTWRRRHPDGPRT
jgi:hypothetical protein